jgi:hypothetical protein
VLAILIISLAIATVTGAIQFSTRYNPFTQKQDFYTYYNGSDNITVECLNLSGDLRCAWPTGTAGGGNSTEEVQDSYGALVDKTIIYNDTDNTTGVNITWFQNEGVVNRSINWANYNGTNSSQFENSNGLLHIPSAFLTAFIGVSNALTVTNGVYTTTIVALVGNWSADKTSYTTTAGLPNSHTHNGANITDTSITTGKLMTGTLSAGNISGGTFPAGSYSFTTTVGIGNITDPTDCTSGLFVTGKTAGAWDCSKPATNTTEEIQDAAGALFGGTETGISVTYDDANNDIDFVVSESDPIGSTWPANYTACDSSSKLYFNGRSLACNADSGIGSESDTLATVTNRGATTTNSTTLDSDGDGVTTIGGNLTVDSGTLFVDAPNDRVGIGTPTPTSSLTINSSSNYGGLEVTNSTGSSRLFVNASSGNVGIGTTAPGQKLEVVGTSIVTQSYGTDVITDGTFSVAGLLNWTLGTGWADGTGTATKNADGTGTLSQALTGITASRYWKLVYTISSISGGSITASLNSSGSTGVTYGTTGTKTVYLHSSNSTNTLVFTPSVTGVRAVIDDVSLTLESDNGYAWTQTGKSFRLGIDTTGFPNFVKLTVDGALAPLEISTLELPSVGLSGVSPTALHAYSVAEAARTGNYWAGVINLSSGVVKGWYEKLRVNTLSTDADLEVNNNAGGKVRLTYNNFNGTAVNYADMQVTSGGNLAITPSGGNVGIGTAAPTQKLDVQGTMNVSNITLKANCADGEILKWAGGVGTCGTDTGTGGNTTEEVQDAAGALNGGTETLITVTYDDVNNDIDYVVNNDLHSYSWTNVVDSDITNTLTCSDLVAGSSVVSDAEVDNDITINTTKPINTTSIIYIPQNQMICFYNATGICNQWIKANSSGIFILG